MTRTSLISLALLTAAAPAALADPAGDFELTIASYQRAVEDFQHYWSIALDTRKPIESCDAALKAAQSAGVTTTPEQQKTCEEFKRYHMLAEAERAVTDAKEWLFVLANIDMATNHEENGAKMATSATTCNAELDRLKAAGMPMDINVRVGKAEQVEMPMSEAKAKICAPLAKAGGSFAKDVGSARNERTEKIAKPYKAVGISGDRLELLVDHINYAMYGVGGGELRTPQQLKNASIIFELLGPGTDGLYTLRRYQFKGNTLVSTTSREFILRPGAKYFR